MAAVLEVCAKNRKNGALILLATCLISLILQHFWLRGENVVVFSTSKSEDVETARNRPMSDTVQTMPNNNRTHFDFVAFKKKPGWNFKHIPCHYQCESHLSVNVRYTDQAVDITGADAVFFTTGPFTLEEWRELHYYRSPRQVWVLATQEPASIVPRLLPPKVYRHSTYNWSFTYHSTSDIDGAYGWYIPNRTGPRPLVTDWYASKTKLVAWVSSRHCEGLGWDRTKFVLDLRRLIDVDMYGLCGNRSLPRNDRTVQTVFRDHKFHLSLENSCCSEYLSEKVWNALEKWETVPIVIGGTREEYGRLMPPHSYIHADDYDSLDDLARYITKVGHNASLYNEYFAWKSIGTVKQQSFPSRFPVFKAGACKIADRIKRSQTASPPENESFDPYGPTWFGSCYRCGDHDWIQKYNFWWRRTIFGEDWQDNRTLYWLDRRQNV